MNDSNLDAELAELQRAEERRQAALDEITEAIEAGLLGDTYAGEWLEDDDGSEPTRLVVAVTADPSVAQGHLERIAPDLDIRVVQVDHDLSALERLAERITSDADRSGADLRAIGVDVTENRVVAMLRTLSSPEAKRLTTSFEGAPVIWEEGSVEPA